MTAAAPPKAELAADVAPPRAVVRVDIEALRAVAILAVMGYHSGVPAFEGGFVGVDVFFVISGFLITGGLLRDHARTGRVSLADFYARRVRRLLPASTVVILATLAGMVLINRPIEDAATAADGRSSALFFSNFRFAERATDYFQEDIAVSPFQQFWSLSVEEQFYAAWPLLLGLLLAGAVVTGRPKRMVAAAGAVIIVVASFWVSVRWTSSSQPDAFFLIQSRAWELGVGAIIAIAAPFGRITARAARYLGIGGGLFIAGSVAILDAGSNFPGVLALFPVLGAAAVVVAGSSSRSIVGPGSRPLTMFAGVGRYSYSLYLWHWPVVVYASRSDRISQSWVLLTLVMVVVSVPLAVAQFHVIENPIRHARFLILRRPTITLAFGAVLVGISVLTTIAAPSLASAALDSGRPVTVGVTGEPVIVPTEFVPTNLRPSLAEAREDRLICPTVIDDACRIGSPDAATYVVFWGDSHAGMWLPAMAELAAANEDLQFTVFGLGSCRSLDVGGRTARCQEFIEAAVKSMHANPPDLVVAANLLNRLSPERDELEAAVTALAGAVPESWVAVLSATPSAELSVPHCLARNVNRTERCDMRWPTKLNGDLAAAAATADVAFIDLEPMLCVDGRCPAITADTLIYRDGSHLTRTFTESRAAMLTVLLGAAIGG